MIADGLVDEARRVYPYRHLNSLNTVGYKELFAYFDGKMTLEEAVEKSREIPGSIPRNKSHGIKRISI